MGSKRVYQAAEATKVIGIEDFDPISHNLLVYPNPANDYTTLSIDMAHRADATVDVVNALGQKVMSADYAVESGTNKIRLNTEELATGIDFVNVTIEGKSQTVKLTVQ